jgi:hypothetical protein
LGRTATAAFKHASSSNPRRQFTAPSAKSLVEGRRTKEHIIRTGDPRDIPFRDVLVEGRRITEHPFHVGDFRDDPFRDVLVERIRPYEHSIHVGDFRDVPCRDVLVERKSPIEHRSHAGDLRDVPFRDVLVERKCPIEHIIHADNTRHVPRRDVRVERTLLVEQPIHVGDSRDVPTVDVTVLYSRFTFIADPIINSTLQGIIRESNRGFREGERVEYNSSKRVRDDMRSSLRLVRFQSVVYLGLLEGCNTYDGCASQGGTYLQQWSLQASVRTEGRRCRRDERQHFSSLFVLNKEQARQVKIQKKV